MLNHTPPDKNYTVLPWQKPNRHFERGGYRIAVADKNNCKIFGLDIKLFLVQLAAGWIMVGGVNFGNAFVNQPVGVIRTSIP